MSLTYRVIGWTGTSVLFWVAGTQTRMLSKVCLPKTINEARRVTQMHYFHQNIRAFSNMPEFKPCWKCGKAERKTHFFCENCKSLQKPSENYNYFSLLGIEENFELNRSDLSKKFRQLQALLHPDKFSNAPDEEKKFSEEISSYINKAFHILSNPYERGVYILSLQGIAIIEENTSLNKEFLMEVMELNEELESISTQSELKEFYSRNKNTLEQFIQRVSKAFTQQDFNSARIALMEMKYYITLELKIKEKLLE